MRRAAKGCQGTQATRIAPCPVSRTRGLSVRTRLLSGPQAPPCRHARQRRWAFESLSNGRPQFRQTRWRIPSGQVLAEGRDPGHVRCAISPRFRMWYRPNKIGREQMAHIGVSVAIDLPSST